MPGTGAADEAYADLLGRLKPPSRELLVESQRRWVAFRDAELALWRAQAEGADDLNAEINRHQRRRRHRPGAGPLSPEIPRLFLDRLTRAPMMAALTGGPA